MATDMQLIQSNNTLFNHISPTKTCFTNYVYNLKQLEVPLSSTCTLVWPTKQQRTQPLRSCLQVKDFQQKSNSRKKKTVVFADDKGLQLTHVKIFKTKQDELDIMKHLLKLKLSYTPTITYRNCTWSMQFPQPYFRLTFYEKLDDLKVTLDRVILKNSDNIALGTVKVKNLAFEKEVFIRSTDNLWTSQLDTSCSYVNSDKNSLDCDVFSFDIKLPIYSKTFEFCIGFRCAGKEFWDNNYGRNYLLTRSHNY